MTWDLRRYLGLSIDDLGLTVTWGEAIDLVSELTRESGSHLFAALAGFRFAASQADLAGIVHAEAFLNVNRDAKEYPEPIRLPSPISSPEHELPTDEELTRARATLDESSMFAA